MVQAIKSHELDLLALGNVYVMKSHKGEQVSWRHSPRWPAFCVQSFLPAAAH
jgi:hypothetical protein